MTQEQVKELFDYDPEGYLVWRQNRGTNKTKGCRAGHIAPNGYQITTILGKRHLVHRLVYLWHHGSVPEFLDHIDGDRSNSKIENLRPATKSQNGMNRKSAKNSSSKYLGVSWSKHNKKWRAGIRLNGKRINLGYFTSEAAAAIAYNQAAKQFFAEYANLNAVGDFA